MFENRLVREIGSEFWQRYPVADNKLENERYLLSGRTALWFIIEDIKKNRIFRKALLPSYCCESMIDPFRRMGIEVQFYHVGIDYVNYPFNNDSDVVLLIDYFGYINFQNIEIARMAKKAGKIVIYDATHKIDGNENVQCYADYSFCSYRKWFYCNCSKLIKHNGVFDNDIELEFNDSYCDLRNKASELKESYILGQIDNKEEFLELYSQAEQLLKIDYKGYAGTPVSVDVEEIVRRRRENALYLTSELRKVPEIKLWRNDINEDDVPMFVPILVDSLVRNDIRSALIKEKIYCPIHWPQPTLGNIDDDLYNRELSLVCDQRYDISDMQRIVEAIKLYFGR